MFIFLIFSHDFRYLLSLWFPKFLQILNKNSQSPLMFLQTSQAIPYWCYNTFFTFSALQSFTIQLYMGCRPIRYGAAYIVVPVRKVYEVQSLFQLASCMCQPVSPRSKFGLIFFCYRFITGTGTGTQSKDTVPVLLRSK